MARQDIVDYARRYLGSHYIHGGTGDVPDTWDNGVFYQPFSVDDADPSTDYTSPCVCAAKGIWNQNFGYVCAGRFKAYPGGRYASSGDWDLQNYLDQLSGISPDRWRPYMAPPSYNPAQLGWSPRLVKGAGVDDAHRIVWGEPCGGKHHFDCNGFVNYILAAKTSHQFRYSLAQYEQLLGTIITEITDETDQQPGDLLVRRNKTGQWGHIGFLSNKQTVIQALEAASGVHEREAYNRKHWFKRCRVADQYIL